MTFTLTLSLNPCASCGQPIPWQAWDNPMRYAAKRFCSKRCAAQAGLARTQAKAVLEQEASVPRCVCHLPLLPGEALCELCSLEGLDASDPEASPRSTRITAEAGSEGYVSLLTLWFHGRLPAGATSYKVDAGEEGKREPHTWLDELLDRRQPAEVEEDVA